MATQPYVRPPTIHDVARVAKLSKSTVSNVIRNAVGVHPATRERVQAAIVELDYQTNIVARQLVQQRTSILGIVIGDLADPFQAEIAKLIGGFTAALSYQVMFCNAPSDGNPEAEGIRRMLEHRVAGLLFLSCRAAAEQARHLIGSRVPSVFVCCSAGWGDVVSIDERAGALTAISHLIVEGHRAIWHLADAPSDSRYACDRELGYADAMLAAGLQPRTLCISRDGETATIGGVAMPIADVLLGDERPTAVFAVNDMRALQIMQIAERLGLGVPDKLSVLGFDDAGSAGHGRMELSTIAQPKEQLAQLAVDTLVRRIAGGAGTEPARHLLGFQLMLRRSTATHHQATERLESFPALLSA
ncbi:LacI family DNA-binding transcriptional regulator [Acidisoma sp.]|uniref:LacI family DNA-binding transcriptional regulator n=1 Tax=Acidisoma sp. TaxID=1872115 RepID=UPI003B00928E